ALVDTSFLQPTILFGTIVMIYATMVGFQFKELTSLKGTKVLVLSIIINFAIIPFVAYLLGKGLLQQYPFMFAGLALSSLLPTRGMTFSCIVIHKVNVPAAFNLTVVC